MPVPLLRCRGHSLSMLRHALKVVACAPVLAEYSVRDTEASQRRERLCGIQMRFQQSKSATISKLSEKIRPRHSGFHAARVRPCYRANAEGQCGADGAGDPQCFRRLNFLPHNKAKNKAKRNFGTKKIPQSLAALRDCDGGRYRTRTCDPLHVKQVL